MLHNFLYSAVFVKLAGYCGNKWREGKKGS